MTSEEKRNWIIGIVKESGLSKAAFARMYKLPLRTLEDWMAGKSLPRSDFPYQFYWLGSLVQHNTEKDLHPSLAAERQIEEMETAETADGIISNRFM